jgi:hypothetical protein
MTVSLKVFILALIVFSFLDISKSQTLGNRASQQNPGLTIELVVSLVKAGVPADQIVETIRRTPSDFNLSLDVIDNLRKAGIPPIVIDAMIRARRVGMVSLSNPPNPIRNQESGSGNTALVGSSQSESNEFVLSDSDLERLQQGKTFGIPDHPWEPPTKEKDPGCPTMDGKPYRVDLDYDTGSSSDSHLQKTGMYCFALRNANSLYDWSVVVNVAEPTGNPFDLINDAISTLKKLATGAAEAAAKAPQPGAKAESAAAKECRVNLTEVSQKADTLRQLLAKLVPGKDSNGKPAYIPRATTVKDWQPIPTAFNEFEKAVRDLQASLPTVSPKVPCDPKLLAQAETIILEDYPNVQKQYRELATRLSRPDVFYYERRLEATSSADLIATPSYGGVADGSKSFHFEPSFGILTSSAGFLLTRLPARSYSSATAPDPADLTKTQNVLKVDFGAGVRPALVVLLTGNLPQVNTRNLGLGISGGPVFDISGGKADTSRFGFFAGPSLRITPWIFLTPGFHFGEFADFPQGFSRSGQVIPANTGTPTPVKRFTGRFAFAFTFKLKDLGAVIGSGGENKSK